MSKESNRRACSECPSSYRLDPPADSRYSEPRLQPDSDDHIKQIYECEEGHRNTVYWHKKEIGVASSEYMTEGLRQGNLEDYRSTKHGRRL